MPGYIRTRCGRSSGGSMRAAKQREIFSRGSWRGACFRLVKKRNAASRGSVDCTCVFGRYGAIEARSHPIGAKRLEAAS